MSREQSMAYCSTCGPYTKIDEDGCCAYCGEDAEPIPANAEEMAKAVSDIRADNDRLAADLARVTEERDDAELELDAISIAVGEREIIRCGGQREGTAPAVNRMIDDLARAQVTLDRISGALHDAGTVVPDDPEAAIRALIEERDELSAETDEAKRVLRSLHRWEPDPLVVQRDRLVDIVNAARSDLARERERVKALEGLVSTLLLFCEEDGDVVNGFRTRELIGQIRVALSPPPGDAKGARGKENG